jgi:hypothetical protein
MSLPLFAALVAAPKPEATPRAAKRDVSILTSTVFPFEVDVAQIRHSQLIVCLSLPVCCLFMPAPNCRIGVGQEQKLASDKPVNE